METKIEKGQFWKNTQHMQQLVEIIDIKTKNNKLIETDVRIWVQTGKEKVCLVNIKPKTLKVFKDEFRFWKLVDMNSF